MVDCQDESSVDVILAYKPTKFVDIVALEGAVEAKETVFVYTPHTRISPQSNSASDGAACLILDSTTKYRSTVWK
jgi:hypothetical protein